MKQLNSILIATAMIGILPYQPSVQAQATAPARTAASNGQHKLLSPSTICVVKLTAESLSSPSGFLRLPDVTPFVEAMQEYGQSKDVFITIGSPEARRSLPVSVYVEQQGRTAEEVSAAMGPLGFGPIEASNGYFVMPLLLPSGSPPTLTKWEDDSDRFAELDAAFNAVHDNDVQIAFLPPRYLWQTYREVQPMLPEELGGGPSSLLTDGVVWAAVGINAAELKVSFHIQSATDHAASELAKAVPTWVTILAKSLSGGQSEEVANLIGTLEKHVSPQGATVIGSIGIKGGSPDAAKETLSRVLAPVSNRQKSDQLKHMMLACHNYESANKYWPVLPEARGEDGKPWLSWRVHILPYLGKEGMEIWQQFHLDEPWNSEHNMTLLDKMPDVYAIPRGVLPSQHFRPGYTTFQAPIADNTIAGQKEAVTFRDMTDGTSNTIAIVEVKPENAVPWTAPQDYEFDAETPAAGLYTEADGKFNCAFADGSTHRLPVDLPPKAFRDLFGMNDGQVTQLP